MQVRDLKLLAAGGVATAAILYVLKRRSKASAPAPLPAKAFPVVTYKPDVELAGSETLTVSGTMLLCTQNLAVSGANQVLLNLVEGKIWRGNTVVLSPTTGPFAKEFSDLGVAVQIGSLPDLLKRISDVRLAVCNTIMTAHLVVALSRAAIPQMWILHEWWPGQMLVDELTQRNDKNTTPEIVREALKVCERTVCVCASQRELYKPARGVVTFVGVPTPRPDWQVGTPGKRANTITFLCLGIVCPRKNQHWAVEVFKTWAGARKDVRLLVVGARYVRQYEIEYVDKVKAIIGDDKRIELHEARLRAQTLAHTVACTHAHVPTCALFFQHTRPLNSPPHTPGPWSGHERRRPVLQAVRRAPLHITQRGGPSVLLPRTFATSLALALALALISPTLTFALSR